MSSNRERGPLDPTPPSSNQMKTHVVELAPRRVLLVSATDDAASQDASEIISMVRDACAALGVTEHVEHRRYEGEHAVTPERFDDMVQWLVACAGQVS